MRKTGLVVGSKIQVNMPGSKDQPFRIPATADTPRILDNLNSSPISLPDCTPEGSLVLVYSGFPQFETDISSQKNTRVRMYRVHKEDSFVLEEIPIDSTATKEANPYVAFAEDELLPVLSVQISNKLKVEEKLAQIDAIFPGQKLGEELKPPGKHTLILLGTHHLNVVMGLLTPGQLAIYKQSLSVLPST